MNRFLYQNPSLRVSISPLERSEKDSALQSRNSAEKDLVLPKRNSGSETREAKLGHQIKA